MADQIAPSHPKTWSTWLLSLAGAAQPGAVANSANITTTQHIVRRFIP